MILYHPENKRDYMFEHTVFDKETMKIIYGSFYSESPFVKLDEEKVPEELRPLLPYAEFWGISDDSIRELLIDKASSDVQANLKWVLAAFDVKMDRWLAGEEADDPLPSTEYVAFSAMRMAADFI